MAGLTPACAGTSGTCCPARTGTWAHPRVRGDISRSPERPTLGGGSPPRARGHPSVYRGLTPGAGLTPACAGTSCCARTRTSWPRAHPRVRGDIRIEAGDHMTTSGSPPRARGHPRSPPPVGEYRAHPACAGTSHPPVCCPTCTRAHRARDIRPATVVAGVGGLTPACAGTSTGRAPSTSRLGAHPRVRGDIAGRQWSWGSGRGSPPRARGRRAPGCGVGQVEGLTPACAGTFHRAGSTDPSIGAHPRVRGDVASRFSPQVPQEGSPPRARGRRRCTRWRGRSTRAHPRVRGDVAVSSRSMSGPAGLTPACAGTSLSGGEGLGIEGAHPRVRGDVYCSFWWWWWRWGLTPACAGTSLVGQRPKNRWAHPRVRGDVMVGMFGTATILGSPPRARGRRRRDGLPARP